MPYPLRIIMYKLFHTRPVSGEPDISVLWHFTEGLFYFLNYFSEKEGLLKIV